MDQLPFPDHALLATPCGWAATVLQVALTSAILALVGWLVATAYLRKTDVAL